MDGLHALLWWLIVTSGGLIVWPLVYRYVPQKPSSLTLARVTFSLLATLAVVWLSTLKILPFKTIWLWLVVLLLGFGWFIPRWRQALWTHLKTAWKSIVAMELLFLLFFILGVYLRGQMPNLDSLEKFMNIGFLNSLNRTTFLPAADMWFAGGSINYYYAGHIAVAIWQKLGAFNPAIAYNLAMATVFAVTAVLSFSLGYTLLDTKEKKWPARFAGTSAMLLITLGSNGHPILYDERSPLAFIGRAFTRWWPAVAGDHLAYWFPASTRYIGYNPDLADKTIHEFPAYSFIVADLHAHLINLMFVLALLAILVALVRARAEAEPKPLMKGNNTILTAWLQRLRTLVTSPLLIAVALFLSFFQMANYWDFVMYTAVLALTFLFTAEQHERPTLRSFLIFMVQAGLVVFVFLFIQSPLLAVLLYLCLIALNSGLASYKPTRWTAAASDTTFIFGLAHALALPFNLSFEPIGKTIRLTENRTSLYQFLVVWGLILLMAGVTLFLFWREARKTPTTQLLTLFSLSGLLFLLIPEIVYVVDIYGGSYLRANTMFKFTYQGFVLLMTVVAMGAPFMVKRLLAQPTPRRFLAAVLTIGLTLTFLWFPVRAAGQWFGHLSLDNYQGLDGTGPLRTKASELLVLEDEKTLVDYFQVIDWFNREVAGQPTIVEAYGYSYSDANLVSAFTGLPTVIGWATHEWLWRTTLATPNAYGDVVLPRQRDVETIYTADDPAVQRALLAAYNVDYLIVGGLEKAKFNIDPFADSWSELGTLVFETASVRVFQIAKNP